jgi:hypothetical protein
MILFSLFLLTRAETRGENQNNALSAEADSLRDKGTEWQRWKAMSPLCVALRFVPMCLCHFVPASSCKKQAEVFA